MDGKSFLTMLKGALKTLGIASHEDRIKALEDAEAARSAPPGEDKPAAPGEETT